MAGEVAAVAALRQAAVRLGTGEERRRNWRLPGR